MNKITLNFIRKLLNQYVKNEISISRFVELINEEVSFVENSHSTDLDNFTELYVLNNEVNNFILGNFGFKNINDNNDDNCIICINILKGVLIN